MQEEARPPCPAQGRPVEEVNGELVDRAAILARASGNTHVIQEMVKLFLSECPERLCESRTKIHAKDAAGVQVTARALHDAISQFGECDASELVAKVQAFALAHEWAAADETYRGLEKAIHRLESAIAALALDPGDSNSSPSRHWLQ